MIKKSLYNITEEKDSHQVNIEMKHSGLKLQIPKYL